MASAMLSLDRLLYLFRDEVVSAIEKLYLPSRDRKKKLNEAFMLWYLHSVTFGVKDNWIPLTFVVSENDLLYRKHEWKKPINIPWVQTTVNLILQKYHTFSHSGFSKLRWSILMPSQEQRLRSLYTGSEETFESDCNELMSMYRFLGALNNHLSVPPFIFEKGEWIELFGTPVNTVQPSFCSPFPLEKKFGSLGSFFEYDLEEGKKYLCNPPFDEVIMENMANRLLTQLETTANVDIIVIVPVWDPETQKKVGIFCTDKEFSAYQILKTCKFVVQETVLDRQMYQFWDYYNEKYVPASSTHFIHLSTSQVPIDSSALIGKWRFLTV